MDFNFFKEIVQTPAPSGREELLRYKVKEIITPFVDDIKVDNLGNLIAIKKGKKKTKLMISAHLDEVAMRVKYIDQKGFIRFSLTGGIDPRTLLSQRVIIMTESNTLIKGVIGAKPAHYLTATDKTTPTTIDNLFIDLGLSYEETKKIITIGDPIVLERDPLEFGNNLITSKAIDDRAGVYALIKVLENLTSNEATIYAVFSTQEEFGLVGAQGAVFNICPDIAISLDTTGALDTPNIAPQDYVLEVGKGVGITITDGGTIADYKLTKFLRILAEKNNIPYQLKVSSRGANDAKVMQRSAGSVRTCPLSIPVRYIHSNTEVASKNDIDGAYKLALALAQSNLEVI